MKRKRKNLQKKKEKIHTKKKIMRNISKTNQSQYKTNIQGNDEKFQKKNSSKFKNKTHMYGMNNDHITTTKILHIEIFPFVLVVKLKCADFIMDRKKKKLKKI